MISAFRSKEFEWSLTLFADQLKQINEKRKQDHKYFDKVAAKDVLDIIKKEDIIESPFIRKLWCGANAEG